MSKDAVTDGVTCFVRDKRFFLFKIPETDYLRFSRRSRTILCVALISFRNTDNIQIPVATHE